MKRAGVIVVLVLVAALGFAIFLPSATSYRNAPRYVPGKIQPIGNYTSTHYDWIHLRPFVNDRFWLFGTRNGTNHFTCLYDLRERIILGEVLNGAVEQANGDGTKLLVVGHDRPAVDLKARFLKLVQQISGGKISPNVNRTESFWVLNLKDNSSKRVGSVLQYSGEGSRWYTSPGLRYGCTSPTTENASAFVLFDFENDSFARIPVGGQLRGWWGEQSVLLQATNHDFVIYDVVKKQTTVLFSAEDVGQTLEQLKLPSDPANVVTFANWNGTAYDFYFTESDYDFHAKRCFLLKVERTAPKPTLKLVSREFQFEWGGRLNADATQFLYQGESGAVGRGGNGAVYLRNLADNSVRTLVPPDSSGQYSIPRFYGNEVIYYRDRVLWRIGLDGSNNVPLFPTNNPPANP